MNADQIDECVGSLIRRAAVGTRQVRTARRGSRLLCAPITTTMHRCNHVLGGSNFGPVASATGVYNRDIELPMRAVAGCTFQYDESIATAVTSHRYTRLQAPGLSGQS